MNRREFLKTVGIGSGSAIVSLDIARVLALPELPKVLGRTAEAAERDPVTHLLNRIAFGPRPGQVEVVKKISAQAYIEQQLNPLSIDDSASEKRLGKYITLNMTPAEVYRLSKKPTQAIAELDSATLIRAVYSERQLYEVMVTFWSEHFSIWHLKEQVRILKTMDDREVIRKHAMGKFRDLLGASAKSPAMLLYLDNATSSRKHPNENYARELMELHTLGIGNYTEDDVKAVARCFTGWTIYGLRGADPGRFYFNEKMHDKNAKTVLGQEIAADGGMQDGETVLDMLADHPATAHFIAKKLCQRFIADDPPESVVTTVAQTFLSSGGDIPSMLRVIFAAPEFMSAPPKFKRPFEYLVSLFRAFDVQLEGIEGYTPKAAKGRKQLTSLYLLKAMGHLPFDRVTPDGYPDVATEWIGNTLIRWNIPIYVVNEAMPDAATDLAALVTDQGVELKAHPVITYFAQHLLGRPLLESEQATIWNFAAKEGEPDLTTEAGRQRTRNAIALIAASPAYQFR
jgi:uncharacterized protein (DUF1800 family)